MTEQQTPDDDPDPIVQMNVRVPLSLRNEIDARRGNLKLSRDKWVTRALRFALKQPGTPARRRRTVARTERGTSVKGPQQ